MDITHIKNKNLKTWTQTLPFVLKPFKGESLYGFLLRLDSGNSFNPGTVMSMIKKHTTGKMSLNRPGLFVIGKIFDLEKLSEIAGLSYELILDLTLLPALKRLFRIKDVYPALAGYSPFFKICPICMKTGRLPLLHIFQNISICTEHGVSLIDRCKCGEKIRLFTSDIKFFCCPLCNTNYQNIEPKFINDRDIELKTRSLQKSYESILMDGICFINDFEELAKGFENRLKHLAYTQELTHGNYKRIFGYSAANIKNGHGLSNISLSKIIDTLYGLNCTPEQFRNIEYDKKALKIESNNTYKESFEEFSTCPNIYCKYFMKTNENVIRLYGKTRLYTGKEMIEEYCTYCGTRFVGDNIIQSYDYNPGLTMYDIEIAQERIRKWHENLTTTCLEAISKRIPITLTGCFKSAGIPIGKSYFVERLGLVKILEEYALKQRRDFDSWSFELTQNEAEDFLRRIYKKELVK